MQCTLHYGGWGGGQELEMVLDHHPTSTPAEFYKRVKHPTSNFCSEKALISVGPYSDVEPANGYEI